MAMLFLVSKILSMSPSLYQLGLSLPACDRQSTITRGFLLSFKINMEADSLGGAWWLQKVVKSPGSFSLSASSLAFGFHPQDYLMDPDGCCRI